MFTLLLMRGPERFYTERSVGAPVLTSRLKILFEPRFRSLISPLVSDGTSWFVTGQWSISGQPGQELEGVPAACVGRVNSCW